MRKLVIRRGTLDLAETYLAQPLLLVGRSPVCEVLLRAPGIKSVHFILEWTGEGEFDPDHGIWVVSSLQNQEDVPEKEIAGHAHSEGRVIGQRGLNYEGLDFLWVNDEFGRQDLQRGMIKRRIDQEIEDYHVPPGYGLLLEVIRLDANGQTVAGIEHLNQERLGRSRFLRSEPAIGINWENEDPVIQWDQERSDLTSIKGASAQGAQSGIKALRPHEVFKYRGSISTYYLRLVPRLPAISSEKTVIDDPFYLYATLFMALLSFVIFVVIHFTFPQPQPKIEAHPRIARIEIKEIKTEQPQAPPPPIKAPTPPPAPNAEVAPVPKVATMPAPRNSTNPRESKQAPAPSAKATSRGARSARSSKPNPQVKDFTQIGLLGSMKSGRGRQTTVSADQLLKNSSAPSDSASGNSGSIVVQQPLAGVLRADQSSRVGEDSQDVPTDLNRASTNLPADSAFDTKSSAPVARKRGKKGLGLTSEDGSDSDRQSSLSNTEGSGFGESIKGGLNRDEVRRAVLAHRGEIRACYESALIAKPRLKGRVGFKWYISRLGPVTSIELDDTELHNTQVEGCVMNVIKQIRFPQSPNGQPTTVIYPFIFQNS